jgi:hypothetical protein
LVGSLYRIKFHALVNITKGKGIHTIDFKEQALFMGEVCSYGSQSRQGAIVVKRRANLTDEMNELTVILDFVWEDDHW